MTGRKKSKEYSTKIGCEKSTISRKDPPGLAAAAYSTILRTILEYDLLLLKHKSSCRSWGLNEW
jgi:hypothetical protein